jgi:two-component system NarL family response regulator
MKTNPAAVLIIDPHPLMRSSLSAAVAAEFDFVVIEPSASQHNHCVVKLADQEDILFLPHKPDIIVFSLGNFSAENLQTVSSLRQQWLDIPILVLVPADLPEQEETALQYGATAVLAKSASRDELLQSLRSIRPV